jgi:hypothetical protein
MAATYKNWTDEIKQAQTKDQLENVMERYCETVGFTYNPMLEYRGAICLAENLRMFGVAQRFKEAQHKEKFL